MKPGNTLNTSPSVFSPLTTIQKSPWQSPMPYLFGGLAAMLGLITFALLILVCSYWKKSGSLINNYREDGERTNMESGIENPESRKTKEIPIFEEKIVVIMAGDVKPTFLATPISMKASASFDDGDEKRYEKERMKDDDQTERRKEEMIDQDRRLITLSENPSSPRE